MGNKEETRKYYEGIVLELEQNLKSLEKELETYGHRPHMRPGIVKNIENRKKDIEYYKKLIDQYAKEGWINKKSTNSVTKSTTSTVNTKTKKKFGLF